MTNESANSGDTNQADEKYTERLFDKYESPTPKESVCNSGIFFNVVGHHSVFFIFGY